MKLYIAGPVTNCPGYPERFARAENLLQARGFEADNPPRMIGLHPGWAWADYMKAALRIMLRCEGVALLPGWWRSRGARLEALLALRLGMPVRRLASWR